MFRTLFVIGLILVLSALHEAAAQRIKLIGAQAGGYVFFADLGDVKNIRGNLDYSLGDEGRNTSINSILTSAFGGASFEITSKNDRLAYTSGVRYSRVSGTLTMNDLILFNTPYFFYRFRESGLITEYVTLRKIVQKTDFVGLPLEVRWFPFDGKRVRFFVKGAAEINFKVASNTEIGFYEPAMSALRDQVIAELPETANVHGVLSLAGGVRFGKPDVISFGIEFVGPSAFLATDGAGIVDPSVGSGFLFSILVPVNR